MAYIHCKFQVKDSRPAASRPGHFNANRRADAMLYKILGAVLALAGVFLIAGVKHFAFGIILLFIGFYIAMRLGMKPE